MAVGAAAAGALALVGALGPAAPGLHAASSARALSATPRRDPRVPLRSAIFRSRRRLTTGRQPLTRFVVIGPARSAARAASARPDTPPGAGSRRAAERTRPGSAPPRRPGSP